MEDKVKKNEVKKMTRSDGFEDYTAKKKFLSYCCN